jgi:hypothetical protein
MLSGKLRFFRLPSGHRYITAASISGLSSTNFTVQSRGLTLRAVEFSEMITARPG